MPWVISMPSWRLPAAKSKRRYPESKALKLAIMLSAAMFVVSLPALAGVCAPATVPEPITLTLLATGIGAVVVVRKLRDK
jgi:hypothetical protein